MFTLFIGGEVLDGAILVGGEVPDEVADTVASFTFTSAEFAVFECHGVAYGIGTAGIILGAVDGDVFGLHRPTILPCMGASWDVILFNIHLAVEGAGTF